MAVRIRQWKNQMLEPGNYIAENNDDIMTCPVCGGRPAGAQVWVHCPKTQAAICMDHCYSGCRYHDTTASVGHCKYRSCVLDKRKVLDALLDDEEASLCV